ncbi:MAG: GH92 family glycosyl hydrolase [Flavobacteriaceae bacterium]
MKTNYLLYFILLTIWGCGSDQNQDASPYFFVNTFIGTGGHGHTYPGATSPFGMVQLSPDTRLDGWDGCSGYHYTDTQSYGFSHTHLSGTGISDYGDILFQPLAQGQNLSLSSLIQNKGLPYSFNKESELAAPGYYELNYDAAHIKVKLSATKRIGIQNYHFASDTIQKVLLDLNHRDILLDYHLEQVDSVSLRGYRRSKAWAQDQRIYFYTQFSEPIKLVKMPFEPGQEELANRFRIIKTLQPTEDLTLQTALSAVSMEGAQKNFLAEFISWKLLDYKAVAQKVWEQELNKIKVQGSKEDKTIFYSSLYHSLIAPNTYNDVDGSYRGLDQKIHKDSLHNTYTVFSLWDTFRAAHPLYTLIAPEETSEFITTFLKHYKQGGRLPVWELSANETDCMIGYHSIPVIFDAYQKGYRDFDLDLALEAMKASAMADGFGLKSYKKNGYVAAQDEAESVSRTLEYAYDDWCIAQFAGSLNDHKTQAQFISRALNYQNVFDPQTGFMRARVNSGWYSPFDPREVNFNYTEANAWQYSLFVPQDIRGMIRLYQGPQDLEAHLDQMFNASAQTSGRHQADITGLIGQYAHGNEPSHHMAYLYNYIGQASKTQNYVHRIKTELYHNTPDGLSGNEDCGQMSAWYVFSSLGFYPVSPGSNTYSIGQPSFKQAELSLPNGKTLKIKAPKLSDEAIYVKKALLNGKALDSWELNHFDLMRGGVLEFEMTSDASQVPNLETQGTLIDAQIAVSPLISAKSKTFTDSLKIELSLPARNDDTQIYFKRPGQRFQRYEQPFYIHNSETIKAYSALASETRFKENVGPMDKISQEKNSKLVEADFVKIPEGRTIEIQSVYNPQYSAEGNKALIDYQKGGENFRTGYWQGYQGQDVIAIMDLGKIQDITSLNTTYLQDAGSWIWLPKQVRYDISKDGKNFKSLGSINHSIGLDTDHPVLKDFKLNTQARGRYIRMTAVNRGPCPEWHQGAGGDSWIFIDEFEVTN